MKKNIQITLSLSLAVMILFIFSCKKQELAETDPPKIVNLKIQGSTVKDTMEFIKNGKVIAESNTDNGNFEMTTKVSVEASGSEIQIRLKGQSEILTTRKIFADAFQQTITCYYDGSKPYDKITTLKIKGYAKNDILEFVLDNSVIGSGTAANFVDLRIGMESGKNRELQIRKKGETAILLNKEIVADQANQILTFFYDGTKIFDKIDVTKPSNPSNMTLSATFTSIVDVYSGPTDLVVYHVIGGKDTRTDFRIELPSDGSFSKNLELTSASASGTPITSFKYKLVKRGTMEDLPYNIINEFKPILPISGFYSSNIPFASGGSMILIINDRKNVKTTGVAGKGTTFVIGHTDIAEFFK